MLLLLCEGWDYKSEGSGGNRRQRSKTPPERETFQEEVFLSYGNKVSHLVCCHGNHAHDIIGSDIIGSDDL